MFDPCTEDRSRHTALCSLSSADAYAALVEEICQTDEESGADAYAALAASCRHLSNRR